MAGSKQKKNKNGRSCIRPASIFVIAALFAFNCIVSITSLTPKRYEVFEGGVAKETITAPRMVEDPITTEAMRQSARNGVQTVYSIDIALANTLVSGAKSFFSSLSSFRNTANDIRLQSAPTQTLADGSVVSVDDTRSWQDVIQQNDLLALLLKLPVSLTDTTLGYALLDASESDLKVLEELVMSKLQVKLRAGVTEKDLDRTRTEINKELQITTLPVRLKSLGEMLFNAYLLPTNVEDTTATTRAKEKAAAEVEPAFISRGATIVEQGQTVTADQMHLLTSLDLVKGGNVNSMFNVGIALYLFCAYALLFFYLRTFECDVFSSTKQMVLLLLIVAITVAVQWLCYIIDPRVMPGIFAVMLVSTLVSKTVAQAINVTLAMTLSLLAGGSGTTLFSSDSLLAMAAMLVTGQAAILMSQKSEKRGALIAAGTVGSIFGGVVIVSGSMILAYTWNSALIYAGLHVAAGLILSVFCVGMLSVWENVFDIVTNARLHELANTNHPLLKKMMTAAPGTYHHSMMAASLAEGAAEAIGANSLLARTGAMYHDVGKLRRPQYFKENQSNGRNIHDTLPPEESAGYIIAHVKDADALLNKYRMPSAIRKIANEHHGTTLVSYFYYKAKQQQTVDGEPVIERLFRYNGNLPNTKESAIVMLADSCEAAVRSLGDPTKDEVANMVRKVVQSKLDDGQLNECPLTFAEITKIEKSFLVTFSGLMHERIRYPGIESK